MTGPQATRRTWAVSKVDTAAVGALCDSGLSPVVSRLLVARGITDVDAARRFLSPSMDAEWRDPGSLPGMREAADMVAAAVSSDRHIVVFGDFDADGLTAAAIMSRALSKMGARVEVVIPDRFRDGYGLTLGILPRVLALEPDLVVTVDCGISAAAEVVALREAGVDVVVTDHHEIGEALPQGVPVTGPKLSAEYPFQGLAGAGVALKLAQAVGSRLGYEDIHRELCDIAAIGTVGDVVPLLDENRGLVADGIARMRRDPRPGIAALADVAGIDMASIDSGSIAFGLVPRLNAAGRLGDPLVALELLTTDDRDEAISIAKELDGLNRLRRVEEQDLFDVAVGEAEDQVRDGVSAVVVAGEGWHEGVRGIVASRLVRRCGVPSLVFSIEGDEARGSGRSVPGVDLHAVLSSLPVSLERFGGHAMAVGVTLAADLLDPFREALRTAVAGIPHERPALEIDAEMTLEDAGPGTVAEIALLEPFGESNPRPLFGTRGVFMNRRKRVGKTEDHLIFEAYDGVSSVSAVAFRCPEIEEVADHDVAVDLVYELGQDEWRGRSRTRLMVREILRHPEDPLAPAATLVEDLFEAAPAILAREEYAGIGEAESFHTKLAGVTFEGRQEVVAGLECGSSLRLERQPDNPHDPNACALLALDGRQVGFLNRRLAGVLAPLIDGGLDLDVTATDVTGGEPDRSLGVNVLVARRGSADDGPVVDLQEVRGSLASFGPEELDGSLVRHFIGENPLHDAQRRALGHLGEGRDCLAVMATGRGKSLIFHVHAAREAITKDLASVFVYPLRALVSDQAFYLRESLAEVGVACETVTGETVQGRRDLAFEGLGNGSLDVVLTTPEFLDRHASRFAESGRIGFVVIDEAHHVGLSRSGHRPAYSRMGEVLERLGRPRVLAVTATAGDEIAAVILDTLGVEQVVVDPSIRGNLHIADCRGTKDKLAILASLASRGEKVVVYVNSRDKSIHIASQLRQKVPGLRHRVAFYNGGVTRSARHAVERAFRDGDLTAIVATSAFGEGVNIPDVRHVVHFHMPFNEVEFNQMSGRAGRDGLPATIHLAYGPRDSRLNELILDSVAPERDDLAQLYLVLKDAQAADGEAFEVTNAELAEEVTSRRPRSKMSDRGVSAALGVFRELGLVEGEGAGAYRRLRLAPRPDGGVDLASSVRYAEGMREKETFQAFKEWALEASVDDLLACFNRPILPTQYT